MQISEHLEDGLPIVRVSGEIDLNSSPDLREALGAHANRKPLALLVDFSEVTYIDSSGLATLVEYMQRAVRFGGRFAVGGVNERLRSVFDLARLGEIFLIRSTVVEAKAALASPA